LRVTDFRVEFWFFGAYVVGNCIWIVA